MGSMRWIHWHSCNQRLLQWMHAFRPVRLTKWWLLSQVSSMSLAEEGILHKMTGFRQKKKQKYTGAT